MEASTLLYKSEPIQTGATFLASTSFWKVTDDQVRVHQPPLEPCPGMDAGGLVMFLAFWWWRLTVGALAHAPRPSHLGLGMPAALKTLL